MKLKVLNALYVCLNVLLFLVVVVGFFADSHTVRYPFVVLLIATIVAYYCRRISYFKEIKPQSLFLIGKRGACLWGGVASLAGIMLMLGLCVELIFSLDIFRSISFLYFFLLWNAFTWIDGNRILYYYTFMSDAIAKPGYGAARIRWADVDRVEGAENSTMLSLILKNGAIKRLQIDKVTQVSIPVLLTFMESKTKA